MMMLPDDIHERACQKALSLVTDEWADLQTVMIRTLPPSVMSEVLGTLRDRGLVEFGKRRNGAIRIRKAKVST